MARQTERIAIVIALLVLAPYAAVRGQQMVNSGAALDANLRLGSGGYNHAVGGGGVGFGGGGGGGFGGGHRAFGGVGTGRFPGRSGAFRPQGYDPWRGGSVDRYNAFVDERVYQPGRGGQGWGSAVQTVRPAPGQPGPGRPAPAPAPSRGYGEGFDVGYEAGLADAQYESETAQRQADTISYGVGFALGERVLARLRADDVEADLETLIVGYRDGLQANVPRLPEDQILAILHELHDEVMLADVAEDLESDPEFRSRYEANTERGQELIEELEAEPDVVEHESGLLYRVLVPGTGPQPAETDTVNVRYRLLRADGEPYTDWMKTKIRPKYSLEGIRIALTTMKVGATWQVAMPPELAHGSHGRPPYAGPNTTMFIEVELLGTE